MTKNIKIAQVMGQDIYEGATIKVQYFDGQFAYGTPIEGEIVYKDFGYKIKSGNHFERLDGFVWWNGKKGFKILEYN